MPRVKRGTIHVKRRRKLRKKVKGFRGGRKNLIKLGKQAAIKAGSRAFEGRKQRKRDIRGIWQIRIGAFVRAEGISYSKFIAGLKKQKIELDRKVMAEMAQNDKKAMKAIVEKVKSSGK